MDTRQDAATEKKMHLVCGTAETLAKMKCNEVIYQILAIDDPKEYPLSGVALLNPISTYSSKYGACTTTIVTDLTGYRPYSISTPNCDCSDPKNYNFADKGRFKM